MTRMRRRAKPTGDDGLGMVLVLGMAGILTGLMIVSTTSAIRSIESSRQHVNFEGALAVADGGIDAALARSRDAYIASGSVDTYTTPSPTDATCVAPAVAWPFTSQPTAAQERTWARAQLESLADTSGCLQTSASGQYVTLKPTGRQVIYSLGWTPRRGAGEVKARLVKAEYLFTPYAPTHAILTGGDISIDSSTKVTTAPPNDPSLAAVHTNGAITVTSGNPIVHGLVSQSGANPTAESNNFASNTGGDVVGAAKETIPFEGARDIWMRNRLSSPPGGWYDLCPDGTVQSPTGAAPCTGSLLADVSTGGTFRGWSFNGSGTVPVWSAGNDLKLGGNSGTYYAHHSDVTNPASNTGPAVPNLTVLASSPTLSPCNKTAGNITWGSSDPAAPSLTSTWLVADQDLKTTSNYQAGSASGSTVISGFFIAGDQIQMSTSSNGAYGAVIALDQCDPSGSLVDANSIKNPSIYYDPNAQAPFTDVINNTLWLEYPS